MITVCTLLFLHHLLLLLAVNIASLDGFCQEVKTYDSNDLVALTKLPVKWERFWNRHDMDSMGTMLRNDVDFVNVAGLWIKGKEATVRDHKQKHQGIVFKNSIWLTDSVAIRYVKPDLAILHIGWGVKGDNDSDGTPRAPRHGIFTWFVQKENGVWLLLAGHNVNIREPAVLTK